MIKLLKQVAKLFLLMIIMYFLILPFSQYYGQRYYETNQDYYKALVNYTHYYEDKYCSWNNIGVMQDHFDYNLVRRKIDTKIPPPIFIYDRFINEISFDQCYFYCNYFQFFEREGLISSNDILYLQRNVDDFHSTITRLYYAQFFTYKSPKDDNISNERFIQNLRDDSIKHLIRFSNPNFNEKRDKLIFSVIALDNSNDDEGSFLIYNRYHIIVMMQKVCDIWQLKKEIFIEF